MLTVTETEKLMSRTTENRHNSVTLIYKKEKSLLFKQNIIEFGLRYICKHAMSKHRQKSCR